MNEAIRTLWHEAQKGYNDQMCDPDVIERFAELVLDKAADAVIESDTSPKAILHEPYRTVTNNVLRCLDEKQP